MEKKEEKKKISDEIKKLVILRLKTMPEHFRISIGDYGTFSKQELIEHVSQGDKVGKEIIGMQLEFLRSFKTGKFMRVITKNVYTNNQTKA